MTFRTLPLAALTVRGIDFVFGVIAVERIPCAMVVRMEKLAPALNFGSPLSFAQTVIDFFRRGATS